MQYWSADHTHVLPAMEAEATENHPARVKCRIDSMVFIAETKVVLLKTPP
jgi:hypothetical protein